MGKQQLNKIAFFGPAASGKTWCADYINSAYLYRKVAFASKLKEIAKDLFNVHGKNGKDREILQLLGSKLREIQSYVWIDYLMNSVEEEQHHLPGVVLDDLRYINEADALRTDGWTLIMVTAPEEVRRWRLSTLYPETPLSTYYHASEREWEKIVPDYAINSTEVEATENELDRIMGLLKSKNF